VYEGIEEMEGDLTCQLQLPGKKTGSHLSNFLS